MCLHFLNGILRFRKPQVVLSKNDVKMSALAQFVRESVGKQEFFSETLYCMICQFRFNCL